MKQIAPQKQGLYVVPSFVRQYISIRNDLTKLEQQRRYIESEIVEWGTICICNGDANGQSLPLGELSEDYDLQLTWRKSTDNQIINADKGLKKLDKQIKADYQATTQDNADQINALIEQMEDIKATIDELSYSSEGHQLKAQFLAKLNDIKALDPGKSIITFKVKDKPED